MSRSAESKNLLCRISRAATDLQIFVEVHRRRDCPIPPNPHEDHLLAMPTSVETIDVIRRADIEPLIGTTVAALGRELRTMRKKKLDFDRQKFSQ